jgi:hypothetical protein
MTNSRNALATVDVSPYELRHQVEEILRQRDRYRAGLERIRGLWHDTESSPTQLVNDAVAIAGEALEP